MKKPSIGLLPLYIKLYDDLDSSWRKPLDEWVNNIAAELELLGITVKRSGICRISSEFKTAVKGFEEADVDAIVSVHLAYSPSLESIDAVVATKLPLIVLSTTPDYEYNSPAKLMNNHGIHGVQDFCNLLLRRGKKFILEAGHWKESDLLKRVAAIAQGACITSSFRKARVGLCGRPFEGMGDFSVPAAKLKNDTGATTAPIDMRKLAEFLPTSNSLEVITELKKDRERFRIDKLEEKTHIDSIRTGLAIRKLIDKEKLSAVTICFLEITKASGIPVMPFLELSKAMERGIGYGGEGDVLTAALTGALLTVFPESTFTEIFCPDWKNNILFLSHMGEMNIALASDKPLLTEMQWRFSDIGGATAVAYACLKTGKAILVNLAPTAAGYNLILCPVDMLPEKNSSEWERAIRGWFKSHLPINEFLTAYSNAGGTHHAALVYGDDLDALKSFGSMMGFNTIII